MANGYTDRFGQGMMPVFNINPGATTPLDVGADAAATEAAYFDMMDQRAASNASNIAAFTEGIESLKGLMSDEDQEEEILQNMLMNEAVAPVIGPSGDDAATGKFTPSYDVEPTIMQRAIEGGKGLLGKAKDYFTNNPFEAALTAGSLFNLPLAAIMGGYHYGKENPIPTPDDAVKYGNYEDGNLGVAMDKSGFFDEGSIQRQRELNEALANPDADLPSWYDEMDHEGSMAGAYDSRQFADGGRVNYNTGGLTYAYSPFMDQQQGIDYYGQFADAVPSYGQFNKITLPVEPTDPFQEVKSDPTNPIFTDMGTLRGPRGGPEDRGSYSDRFGTAEDQGYGYSGVPGEGGAATFNNPAFGEYGDTFTPGPGIGQAYDEYGRLRDIGVLNDVGLNVYNAAYPVAQMKPGIIGLFDKMVTGIKNYNDKKAKEEQEAKQKQAEEDAVALSKDIKEQFASYNVGGGDNKPDPGTAGTGTFSDGTVSGFTGQAQSPHSSMSTATPAAVAAAQSYAANVAAAQAARDKNKHNRERGGGGGAGKGGGKGCFVKGTMIEMADGTEKEITTITVGELTKGGVVEAKLEFMPTQIYNYKGVEVSGSHLVMENNQFIKVEDSKRSVLTDKIEPVYCFETSDNRIWVKGIEFGDYLTGSHEQWQPHIDAMLETVNLELNGH